MIKNTNNFERQNQILTSLKFACIKKIKDGENCTYSFTGKYRVWVLLFYKRVVANKENSRRNDKTKSHYQKKIN